MTMKWKIIQEFPDYAVSDAGCVARATRKKKAVLGQTIKPRIDKKGYFYVRLRKEGVRFIRKIHRLVLITFIGVSPPSMECNHKSGIKCNNHIDNLEWVTPKQNMQHAVRMGLYNGWDKKNRNQSGENNSQAKLTTSQVLKIKGLLKIGQLTQRSIAAFFNISYQHVSDIKRGKRWAHLQC